MSQVTSFSQANGAGATVRQGFNAMMAALNSSQSGASPPTTAVTGTVWMDTSVSPPVKKILVSTNPNVWEVTATQKYVQNYSTKAAAQGAENSVLRVDRRLTAPATALPFLPSSYMGKMGDHLEFRDCTGSSGIGLPYGTSCILTVKVPYFGSTIAMIAEATICHGALTGQKFFCESVVGQDAWTPWKSQNQLLDGGASGSGTGNLGRVWHQLAHTNGINTNGNVGAWVVETPYSRTSEIMLDWEVDVWQYGNTRAGTVRGSVYLYKDMAGSDGVTGGFHAPRCNTDGAPWRPAVRYGVNEAGKACIIIGDASDTGYINFISVRVRAALIIPPTSGWSSRMSNDPQVGINGYGGITALVDAVENGARALAGTIIVSEKTSITNAINISTGALYSKTTYNRLWAWLQANRRIVTAAQWQAAAGAGQLSQCFADWDADKFRAPLLDGLYVMGAGTVAGGEFVPQSVAAHKHISPYTDNGCHPFGGGSGARGGSGHTDGDQVWAYTNDGTAFDGGNNPNPSGIVGTFTRPNSVALYQHMYF